MIFLREITSARRRPRAPGETQILRRLPFRHNGVANCSRRRRFRRPRRRCRSRPVRFDLLPLHLLLRRAIAQADFVLLGFQTQDLEFVLVPGCQDSRHTSAACRLFLVAIAFRSPLFDLGNMAKRLNAFRQFNESPEIVVRATLPFRMSPTLCSANQSAQISFSCLMPKESRRFCESTFRTFASTVSPFLNFSLGCLIRSVQLTSLMWISPSMPSSISTNAPKSARLRMRPLTTVPTGYFSAAASHGSGCVCLSPNEIRR